MNETATTGERQDSACDLFRAIAVLAMRLRGAFEAVNRDERFTAPAWCCEMQRVVGFNGRDCTSLEVNLEADPVGLKATFGWNFELSLVEETWSVDRSIRKMWDGLHDVEEEYVVKFPTRTFTTTDSMLQEWEELVEELCASARALDLRLWPVRGDEVRPT